MCSGAGETCLLAKLPLRSRHKLCRKHAALDSQTNHGDSTIDQDLHAARLGRPLHLTQFLSFLGTVGGADLPQQGLGLGLALKVLGVAS